MPDANRVTHVRIARGSGNPTRLTVASGDQKGFFCSLAAATRLHSVRTTALEVAGFPAPQADLREDAGLQDGPVHEHAQALLEALSHGGVRGQQLSHIVHRLLVVDRERRELDDRRRVRADGAHAQHALLAVVGDDDLDEALRPVHRDGAAHVLVTVARHDVRDVLLAALGLVHADGGDLLVEEVNRREVLVTHVAVLRLRRVHVVDDAERLVLRRVDELLRRDGVAARVDVAVRLAAQEAIAVQDAVLDAARRVLEAEPGVDRRTADGDEGAVDLERVVVILDVVFHRVPDAPVLDHVERPQRRVAVERDAL
mmetsp:Transcript_39444/g.121994  ORF Transcript_39444/g.121994 Transcript_39444/m.121994 type:complete len:313 (+) Transcript_39444:220-1158(+)